MRLTSYGQRAVRGARCLVNDIREVGTAEERLDRRRGRCGLLFIGAVLSRDVNRDAEDLWWQKVARSGELVLHPSIGV